MKLKFYSLLVTLVAFFSVSLPLWAQGPEMNKVYTVPMSITANNSYQIPASAFLADATSATVTVTNSGWVTFTVGYYGSNKLAEAPYGSASFSYSFDGDVLAIAKTGNLYVTLEGKSTVVVTVLNKDANYVEPTPGGGGGGTVDPVDPDYTPDYDGQTVGEDGKLVPNAEHKAFGVAVDYNKFPQLTDIPSMYITVYKTDDQGATYDATQTMDISTTKNDWYYQCRIVIADKNGNMKQRDEMVGLRGRGNSTWTWVNSGKRAFRLKFPTKTKLLVNYDMEKGAEDNGDYADAKSWTLMANAFDKTLIHNAFTYELGKNKLTNLSFCPAYRFVDLYVNNVYYGTYQVSDQVQVDKKRVNVNADTGWFLEVTASKNGDFLEAPYITVDKGKLYANIKNPEGATVASGGPDFNAIQSYMTELYKKTASSNQSELDFSFKTGYRTMIDMPSLIDWFIGEEISANYDGTFGNIYTYREAENDKLHFGPMWDLDIAYGGHEGEAMSKKHIWDSPNHAYEGMSNILRSLYTDKYFIRDLYERWQTIYNSGELNTFCNNKIEMLAGLVMQSQEKNFTIARPFGATSTLGINQADNMGGSFASYDAAIAYFKEYVSDRIDWLNTEYSTKYSTMCANLDPCADFGHTYTSNYADNGDGTHSLKCDVCGAVKSGESEAHHTDTYVLQSNGTYKKGCDLCGNLSATDTQTYYEFLVYPESNVTETIMATSWQPSAEHPNSIAVVEAKQSVVEQIEGWNIVAGKKTTFADGSTGLTCKDFRLTDGHPYYSENKFVATNATYRRSISNPVGTICLPYKMQTAENADAKFYHLKDINSEQLTLTPIQPEIEGNASAYVPVVFIAKDGKTSLTVTGENVTVKKVSALEPYMYSDCEGWGIVGTMEKQVIEDVTQLVDAEGNKQYLYYFSGGKLWEATRGYTNNPFRAYFVSMTDIFEEGTVNNARMVMKIDDEVTGITELNHVDEKPVSISRQLIPLPVGQYRIGGKRVVITK